ncbi:MAG: SCO family protein [Rhizobiaceae bacterium]|nr:SCO family protein [Rhizobiaceae bacterium]
MAAEAKVWRSRLIASAILAVVVFGGLGAGLAVGLFGPAAQPTVQIGGPFTLTDQTGAKLSDTDLRGKPFTVFFGFTHCPEVCPTTLWEMSEALKALGPDADRLRVLFISVDPTRDTPEVLSRYMQSFDPRIVGLTGTEQEVEAAGKAYRAYWEKVPTADGDYTMNHTASIFMMDGTGRFVGTIAYEEQADARLAKLKRLIAGT